MLDGNLAMDARRISYIAQLQKGGEVIDRVMDENNPVTLDQLENQFGIEQLHLLQTDPNFMLSLLYYFGVVTINTINDFLNALA